MKKVLIEKWAQFLLEQGHTSRAAEQFAQLEAPQRKRGWKQCAAKLLVNSHDYQSACTYLKFCRDHEIPPSGTGLRRILKSQLKKGLTRHLMRFLAKSGEQVRYPYGMFLTAAEGLIVERRFIEAKDILSCARRFYRRNAPLNSRERKLYRALAEGHASEGRYTDASKIYQQLRAEFPRELLIACPDNALQQINKLIGNRKLPSCSRERAIIRYLKEAKTALKDSDAELSQEQVQLTKLLLMGEGKVKQVENLLELVGKQPSGEDYLAMGLKLIELGDEYNAVYSLHEARRNHTAIPGDAIHPLLKRKLSLPTLLNTYTLFLDHEAAVERISIVAAATGDLAALRFAFARKKQPIPERILLRTQLIGALGTDWSKAEEIFTRLHS